MKKLLLLAGLLFFLINHPLSAQPDMVEDHFQEYFTESDIITIPEDFLLSSISHVSVYRDSLMVITDEFGGAWYRMNLISGDVTKLQPDECFPGFKPAPIGAHFLIDGKILLSSTMNYQGYIFKKDGSCYDIVGKSYRSSFPTHMSAGPDTGLYQISFLNPQGRPQIIALDHKGKKRQEFSIGKTDFPEFARRYRGGGITVTKDGKVWYAFPASNRIYSLDPAQNITEPIDAYRPDYLKPFIREDMPSNSGPEQMMKFMQSLRADHSRNQYLGQLNDRILLSQLVQNEGSSFVYYLMLFDRINRKYLKSRVTMNEPILFSGNNRIYTYIRNEDSPNDNPAIKVLSWTGPTKH